MKKTIITVLLSSLSVLSYAQNEQMVTRKGFVFGTSIGVSNSIQSFPNKSQNDIGFGLGVKLGYMINPNITILLTTNVSGYEYSGIGRTRKRDFGILAPSVQYWFKERFWVLGGIGLGVDAPVFFDIKNPETNKEETEYHSGLGIVGAIGYDIYQGKKFTIDLKARITYRNVNITEGKTSGVSPSLLIGINFY
jgi:outer membrane protein W